MTVIKNKDMNWKRYLRQLAEAHNKISTIERIEFSGYLLRRDMEREDNAKILTQILALYDYGVGDTIASTLIAESPDSKENLFNIIKNLVIDHYNDEVNTLIKEEEKEVAEELREARSKEDPRDEYSPDNMEIEDGYCI